jgi:hypothetical protein
MHVTVCRYNVRVNVIKDKVKDIEIYAVEPFKIKLECMNFVKNTHTRTPIFGAK